MTDHSSDRDAAETFESLRSLLFGIAYRMSGSASDAEDIVQDAYLRHQRALADGTRIDSPRAYLCAVVTRLAIDHLRSARVRRERYVGLWLPEPLLTDAEAGPPAPHPASPETDSLSMAFLLLLERLNPVERAVFLLHDVFGYPYEEIAGIVGKTAINTRRIGSRARRGIQADRPRFEESPEERDRLAAHFFAAVGEGDLDRLIEMLAADAVVYGDGGGKVPQWSQPIVGADRVARLLAGLGRQMRETGVHIEPRRVNGQPGAVMRDPLGQVISVFSLDVRGGAVHALRSVVNPDKLRHLGPVADVRALARGRARGQVHSATNVDSATK